MKAFSIFVVAVLLFVLSPRITFAFDAAATFQKKCSGCHSIGQGDLVGPDLKGITEKRKRDWLFHFIISPGAAVRENDPTAKQLVDKYKMVMPDQDLTKDQIGAILDFIEKGDVSSDAPTAGRQAASASEKEISQGEDLFLGRVRLANGGPACVACHSAGDIGALGGGTFAIDLTQVFSRYDEKILTQALANPGFRVMSEAFSEKPLKDDEVFALKAFLYQADKAGVAGGDYQKKFLFLGLGGTALMLGATDWIWRKRRRKSAKPWGRKSGW